MVFHDPSEGVETTGAYFRDRASTTSTTTTTVEVPSGKLEAMESCMKTPPQIAEAPNKNHSLDKECKKNKNMHKSVFLCVCSQFPIRSI